LKVNIVKETIVVHNALVTARVQLLDDPQAVRALNHPVRLQLLEALRVPASAAGIAREIGEPRQKVNYHLKQLERGGLVEPAGERRVGNMLERLYRAAASTFVVSPRLGFSGERRIDALRDQVSLRNLVDVGERLQRDATGLLDRAAYDGEQISSAAVEADVRFPDAAARSAFMERYLAAIGPLLREYGAAEGEPFRVAMVIYADPERDAEDQELDSP
jgi:DNA-binding transcriptional ArsR family regulator